MDFAPQKKSVGDLVCMLPDSVGEVASCGIDDSGELIAIVRLLVWVRAITERSSRWSKSEELAVWQARLITMPRAWYAREDDWVLVV